MVRQDCIKVNPVYGEGRAIAGHFLVLNRRYEEGIASSAKRSSSIPTCSRPASELGVNLMRLGEEKEAYRGNSSAPATPATRSDATKNSLVLMDSYKNFLTYKTDNTIVKLHKKEAELLGRTSKAS